MIFKIIIASSPKAFKEVIEGTDTGNVPRLEAAKNGVVRNPFHFMNPFGKADFGFGHEKEEIGTKHGSRITRFRAFMSMGFKQTLVPSLSANAERLF